MNDLSVLSPGSNTFVIIPSNDNFIKTRGIYLAETADLHVIMVGGQDVIFENLAGGVIHPLHVIMVLEDGTTTKKIIGII